MSGGAAAFDRYQRRLLVFLSVATFFEGFDFFALSQVLPNLRSELQLSRSGGGTLLAFVNIGTCLAFLLIRQADRWGRRRVLSWTIAGYALSTAASGLAPTISTFAVAQLLARVFLIGEWAVATMYAAEEFPAAQRGLVIGIIQANASLGAVVCAGVVPLVLRSALGWRGVFFVGLPPLALLMVLRSGLQESRRFLQSRDEASPSSLLAIWRTPYRTQVIVLAAIWSLAYVFTQSAVFFWKDFAVTELRLSPSQVSACMVFAAIASMPLVFYAGRILDRLGRRRGAVIILLCSSVGIAGSYWLERPVALAAALTAGVFGASSVVPLLNAYTAELFPTHLRGQGFAWANNLIARISYILAPAAVGWAADWNGLGYRGAMAGVALSPLLTCALILALLPETSGKELEETAASPARSPRAEPLVARGQ